jgi:hypothetical protein
MMTAGMLFSQMTPTAEERSRFERWYDSDHIANRMELDGFAAAHRYWERPVDPTATAHHLAIYELDSLEALDTTDYRSLKADPGEETEYFLSHVSGFTRFTTERISDAGDAQAHGDFLSVVAFAVPDDDVDEFEDWYSGEHVPLLLEADDWLRVHRYRVVDGEGGPWTHLALHELTSLEVMDSPERARARSGPRRDRLAGRPWFGASGRWLYERVATHYVS